MKYHVGDKVKYFSAEACYPYNMVGTVIGFTSESDSIPYLVEFPGFNGHDGSRSVTFSEGGCRNSANCWWCEEASLVPQMTAVRTNREWIGSLDNHDFAKLFVNYACLVRIDKSDDAPKTFRDVVVESETDTFWMGSIERWLDKPQKFMIREAE